MKRRIQAFYLLLSTIFFIQTTKPFNSYCINNIERDINVSKYILNHFSSNDFVVEYVSECVDLVGSIPIDIQIIINSIKRPKRFKRVGASLPKGILMIGAPGVGKTTLARYIAKETECPIIISSAALFIEVYVGTGPAAVRDLFQTARNYLEIQETYSDKEEVKPVIIFIDEIDSIGMSRSNLTNGACNERRNTLNQLFTEMEGIRKCDNIIVIAATNENEKYFDPALLSRFTYIAHIPTPNQSDRRAILHYYSANRKFDRGVTLEYLAADEYTIGYSGRDLRKLVEHIACIAANDMSIPDDKVVITQNHVKQGYEEYHQRKVLEGNL